ncbi:MAG TPA: hypothetical protein VGC95_05920 [Chitinophagaceae bacterium]
MRTSTKLKVILRDHTIGISYTDRFEMTVIGLKQKMRRQFEGKNLSGIVDRAFKAVCKDQKGTEPVKVSKEA